jgi:hypothetical protein
LASLYLCTDQRGEAERVDPSAGEALEKSKVKRKSIYSIRGYQAEIASEMREQDDDEIPVEGYVYVPDMRYK